MTMQIGLGLAMMLDPLQRAQNGTVGVLASWLSGTAFIGMGLHHQCLLLVGQSFAQVPPGSGVLPTAAAPLLMAAVGSCISLGLQLAGPVLVLVWLVNCFVALPCRCTSTSTPTTLSRSASRAACTLSSAAAPASSRATVV